MTISIHSMKTIIIHVWAKVKSWLQSLSFRTGVIVLLCCIFLYIVLCPAAAAYKCCCQRSALDCIVWNGKDLSVWRSHDSWCRRL